MRIPIEALSARLVASRDRGRGCLQALRLERGLCSGKARAAATDGKILAVREFPDEAGPAFAVNLEAAGVAPAQKMAKLLKAEELTIDEAAANGTASLAWQGKAPGELAVKTDDGQYPDIDVILKGEGGRKEKVAVLVNLDLLLDALECLKAIAPAPAEKGAPILARIEITDAAHVLRFKVGDAAAVYLMPMVGVKGVK